MLNTTFCFLCARVCMCVCVCASDRSSRKSDRSVQRAAAAAGSNRSITPATVGPPATVGSHRPFNRSITPLLNPRGLGLGQTNSW